MNLFNYFFTLNLIIIQCFITIFGHTAIEIDNAIVGEPILECDAGFITLKIQTKSLFMGRMFLKGMASTVNNNKNNFKKSCEIRASNACQQLSTIEQLNEIKNRQKFKKNVSSINSKRRKNFSSKNENNLNNSVVTETLNNKIMDLCSMRVYFDGDANGCPPLRRQRSLNPRGVTVIATIVVSFHPFFITKIDRMYRLQCFYLNSNNGMAATVEMVKAAFYVSGAPKSLLSHSLNSKQSFVMPICRYEILENGPNGNPVIFSTLGTKLYHKWSCETSKPNEFCFRVHSCYAKAADGLGVVEIIDSDGCSIDKYLLTNLNYSTSTNGNSLVAGQFSSAYKYADEESMYFQCQIKIWRQKTLNECPKLVCAEPKAYGDIRQMTNSNEKFTSNNLINHPKRSSEINNKLENFNDGENIDVNIDISIIEDLENKFDKQCDRPNLAEPQMQKSNNNLITSINYCFAIDYLIFIIIGIITSTVILNIIIHQTFKLIYKI